MRRLIYSLLIINFLLICLTGQSYCYAADSKLELEWDYLTSFNKGRLDRDIDTVSIHMLKEIATKGNKSLYRGITITRPTGSIKYDDRIQDRSVVGIGPTYMIRAKKHHSDKVSTALDISGSFLVYNKAFPAGGRAFNFMWRIGPKLIYKTGEDSSINIGYTIMHVSNGFNSHNPGYEANGVSIGFVTKF